jgi:hypothetical protein
MRPHHGLRLLIGAIFGLTLILGGPLAAAAQTPVATPAPAASGPVMGEGVLLYGPSGREVAQIAVLQIEDPYQAATLADRGYHWVGIELLVQNLGQADFWLNANDVRLIDSTGINNVPAVPVRDEADTIARPDLPFDPVATGELGGGWLFYEVIDGATSVHIVYSSSYAYELLFLELANLDGEIADAGEATTVYSSDSSPTGSITVDEIIPDVAEIDPEIEVPRGRTELAVAVTITNETGAELEPYAFNLAVVDELGFLYSPDFVLRGEDSSAGYPDFRSGPLAAGESRSGTLFYELPTEASLAYVVYRPGQFFENLFIVAQPGDGSARSGETFAPQDSVTALVSAECAGVADWVKSTNLSFLILPDPFGDGGIAGADPDQLRDAAGEVATTRVVQGTVVTPEIARDAQQAFLAMLAAFEVTLDDIADRLEAGEDAAAIEADYSDPDNAFLVSITAVEEAVANLESACPDSNVADLGL